MSLPWVKPTETMRDLTTPKGLNVVWHLVGKKKVLQPAWSIK